MDKLVAQYTRSPHQNEFYSEQEQRDLTESLPPLSLKFNLPPIDNVRMTFSRSSFRLEQFGCDHVMGYIMHLQTWAASSLRSIKDIR